MPTISSRAFGRTIIGWTMTPAMCASGRVGAGARRLPLRRRRARRRASIRSSLHAADIRLVDDVVGEDLDRDGVPLGEQRCGLRGGLLRRRGERDRHRRDVVGLGQPCRPRSGRARCGPRRGRGRRSCVPGRVRREVRRQRRRRLHQRVQRLAVADEVHEAAHRVGLGVVVRNARRVEDRGDARRRCRPRRRAPAWARSCGPFSATTRSATVRADPVAEASAVWAFITSTASLSGSASSASSAAP